MTSLKLAPHAWLVSVIIAERRGVAQSGRAPAWGVGGRRFESDHPDQKKKRVVNTSIETSVNSSFRLAASPRLRDVLNSFIYSSAHKHQGANDFPADLYLEGMKGPPFISSTFIPMISLELIPSCFHGYLLVDFWHCHK